MNTHQTGELEDTSTFFWFRTRGRPCGPSFGAFTVPQVSIFFFIRLTCCIWQGTASAITCCLSPLNNIDAAVAFWVSVKGLGMLKTFWPRGGWKQRYLSSMSRLCIFETSCQKKRVSSRFLNEVARVSASTIIRSIMSDTSAGRWYWIIDHELYYKSRHTGSSGREGLEASFAWSLPSHHECVVGRGG